MASQAQVREFLAHWFQLGKPIVLDNGKAECLPYPIFFGKRYSQAFEECWQQIIHVGGEGCYLKGTDQTVAMLLSSGWELLPCARCTMPIPLPDLGNAAQGCPCHDLTLWPNSEVPMPRVGVDTTHRLGDLQKRLKRMEENWETTRSVYEPDDVARAMASWRTTS